MATFAVYETEDSFLPWRKFVPYCPNCVQSQNTYPCDLNNIFYNGSNPSAYVELHGGVNWKQYISNLVGSSKGRFYVSLFLINIDTDELYDLTDETLVEFDNADEIPDRIPVYLTEKRNDMTVLPKFYNNAGKYALKLFVSISKEGWGFTGYEFVANETISESDSAQFITFTMPSFSIRLNGGNGVYTKLGSTITPQNVPYNAEKIIEIKFDDLDNVWRSANGIYEITAINMPRNISGTSSCSVYISSGTGDSYESYSFLMSYYVLKDFRVDPNINLKTRIVKQDFNGHNIVAWLNARLDSNNNIVPYVEVSKTGQSGYDSITTVANWEQIDNDPTLEYAFSPWNFTYKNLYESKGSITLTFKVIDNNMPTGTMRLFEDYDNPISNARHSYYRKQSTIELGYTSFKIASVVATLNKTYYKGISDTLDITISKFKFKSVRGDYSTIGNEYERDEDSQDISYIIHRKDSDVSITNGSSIGTDGEVQVDVTLNYNGVEFTFNNLPISLNRQEDALSQVVITDDIELTIGKSYSAQKDKFIGKMKAVLTSGTEIIASSSNIGMFSFATDTLEDATTTTGLTFPTIKYNDETPSQTVTDSHITYVRPTDCSITVVSMGKKDFRNSIDKINLTDVTFNVSYTGATKTDTLDYSDATFSLLDESKNTIADQPTFDGTSAVNIQLNDEVCDNCFIRVSIAAGKLLTNTAKTVDIPVKIFGIAEIIGIKIMNICNEYKVGDKFLEIPAENDEATGTMIRLYFKDSSNNIVSTDTLLSSDYAALSVYPQKGEEFNNVIFSQQVVVKSIFSNLISAEYTINIAPENVSNSAKPTIDLVAVWQKSITLPNYEVVSPEKGVLVLVKNDPDHISYNDGIMSVADFEGMRKYGYIDNIFDKNSQAKVILFDDYIPPIDGASNISVEFPSYNKGSADQINKAQFGILFGTNNATNRLFVSGNPDYPNADWHSSEINTTNIDGVVRKTNGDFSYFTDQSIMYYGETDNSVVGYDIVSNDKLFVLKTKSDKEKTVYFRTPIAIKAVDASGVEMKDIANNSTYQEEFALVKGNNSVAGVNPKTIINFNGDTLFIDSDNKLLGLDLTGIIGDSQRYANSRSKFIDEKIKKYNLEDAILWTNNKYLFVSIPDLGLFVTHFEKKTSDQQYEWWFLTSENPVSFIEIDDVIYFANDKGEIYKFTDKFVDIKKMFIGEGTNVITEIGIGDETVHYGGDLDPTKKYKIAIKGSDDFNKNIYFYVATISKDDTSADFIVSGDLLVKNNLNLQVYEKEPYYLGKAKTDEGYAHEMDQSSTVFKFDTKYFLKKTISNSTEKDVFELYEEGQTTPCQLSTINKIGLFRSLGDCEADVTDIDAINHTFKLSFEGETLDIEHYYTQSSFDLVIDAEIREYKNVEAYYITAPYTMGSLNQFKTIWSFTVTNDTNIPSEIEIARASNKIPTNDMETLAALSRAELGMNFDDLDYLRVDFEKTVVPRTYTTNRVLGMQKFVCFAFKNYNDTNAVLSSMSVVYTVPFPSYGSD